MKTAAQPGGSFLGSQGSSQPIGLDQQVQGIVDGGDHHVAVAEQGAAAAFLAHDADGQVRRIAHLDVVESVADGHYAALHFPGFGGLDFAYLGGGEGQHLQGQTFTALGSGAVGISGDDVDTQFLTELGQPGPDGLDNQAVLGDGAVVIQNQVT